MIIKGVYQKTSFHQGKKLICLQIGVWLGLVRPLSAQIISFLFLHTSLQQTNAAVVDQLITQALPGILLMSCVNKRYMWCTVRFPFVVFIIKYIDLIHLRAPVFGKTTTFFNRTTCFSEIDMKSLAAGVDERRSEAFFQ